MRIPIPAAIATTLITIVAALYFTTRNKDFTQKPTAEELGEITQQWKQENTPQTLIKEKAAAELARLKAKELKIAESKKSAQPPRPEFIPLGDLNQSPKLTEYEQFRDKGTASMIQLAKELENKGAMQRALLAWERVLDTTTPNEDEVKLTAKAIQKLKSEISPWNPDPNSDITITLHVGTSASQKEILNQTLQETANLITEASGYIITVKTKLSIGKTTSKTPRTPIAIWFSRPPQEKSGTPAETPPLSFMADPSQESMLANQFQAAVYALLSNHLAKHTDYSKLPEYPAGVTPEELLEFYVTRLMWREFAQTLK